MCKYAVLSLFEMFLSMCSCIILGDLHSVRLENATNITERKMYIGTALLSCLDFAVAAAALLYICGMA